jgi:predicted nucleotidyltransferase
MKSKLIAYAMDFSSFLIQKTKQKDNIRNIILFGSVARGEAGKESDVDIFIDIIGTKNKTEEEIKKILSTFISSTKYKNYWKALGITKEIKLTIGQLDKWKELKPSIIANGITLYGKFKQKTDGEHITFFIWENIKPNAKRVLFNKQLFGYAQHGKFYSGLLEKFEGKRLGKGCIIVPLEHANKIHNHFKKYKITVKIKKGVVY